MRNAGYAAVVSVLAMATACGGDADNPDESGNGSESSPSQSATPPESSASCTLKGSHQADVTLTDTGDELVAEFVGQPVAAIDTTGYFVTVYDEAGETGGQLGMTYLDGEPMAYFVFDSGEASQENLSGAAAVDGDTVTGTFPKSAAPLGDFEVAMWNAAFTLAGKDVGNCPKDMGYLPFSG